MTAALTLHELSRSFGTLVAADKVSFEIQQGGVFGLLGPNGAGKTTILSMLATLLAPTSGSATVNGYDIVQDPDNVRRSIGIVFQDSSLDEELTGWENMDFHGRLYRLPTAVRRQRGLELLTLVGLADRKDDLVKVYSGGMRRRLELARGLLHHPAVLFLDEPTLGLDPQTRNLLWTYIAALVKEKGVTIILTTHYMEEADRLCDRIAIIDHGKIIAIDSPQTLKESLGGDLITIRSPDLSGVARVLRGPWVLRLETHDDRAVISVQNADQCIGPAVTLLNENRVPFSAIAISKPSLEDVFLSLTGKTIRENDADDTDNLRMHLKRARNMRGS
jgi:ABC-2 type transport system ATP-binding protein